MLESQAQSKPLAECRDAGILNAKADGASPSKKCVNMRL